MLIALAPFDPVDRVAVDAEFTPYFGAASRVAHDLLYLLVGKTAVGVTPCANAARALIRILFGVRRPFAIAGFVVPVVVFALDRKPFRALAHVFKKILKGAPAFANGDTAASVVNVVQAPVEHVFPRFVSGRHTTPRRMAVLPKPLAMHVCFETSAGSRSSANDLRRRNTHHVAAVAFAQPKRLLFVRPVSTDNDQSPRLFAGKVSCLHAHEIGSFQLAQRDYLVGADL